MFSASLRKGALALTLGLAAVACQPPATGPKTAQVKPGSLPDGATWNGVWFNAQFGHLHLVSKGSSITGRWKSPGGNWGELTGETDGNVAHFTWTEHKIGMVGPTAMTKGKGYFVYSRPEGEHVDDELKGEWGLNENETGNAWDCVKQRNQKPDPASVGGTKEVGGPQTWE
jgi:hypothetical protein